MKTTRFLALFGIMLVPLAIAAAAPFVHDLTPGDTLDVSCGTTLSATVTASSAHLTCVLPSPTPAPTNAPTSPPEPSATPTSTAAPLLALARSLALALSSGSITPSDAELITSVIEGLLSIAYSASTPGITMTGAAPGMNVTATQPAIAITGAIPGMNFTAAQPTILFEE